ncbi:MAG TPA: hypothetical protein VIC28_15045 [Thermoanaerobaculia bacterium]|jgi:hypothetical protein
MPFGSLWLPVVVSAVAVFLVSAITHMVLKYHKADYKKLSDEEGVAQALRKGAPGPGLYIIPYAMEGQMKDPAVRKKYEEGPVGMLAMMRPAPPNMGKYLGQWFLFCFLVSFATGYVARHAGLGFGADGMQVLRLTATVSFMAYAFGRIQESIWMAIPWPNSLRGLLDGLLYALTTGIVFKLLWPAA